MKKQLGGQSAVDCFAAEAACSLLYSSVAHMGRNTGKACTVCIRLNENF